MFILLCMLYIHVYMLYIYMYVCLYTYMVLITFFKFHYELLFHCLSGHGPRIPIFVYLL